MGEGGQCVGDMLGMYYKEMKERKTKSRRNRRKLTMMRYKNDGQACQQFLETICTYPDILESQSLVRLDSAVTVSCIIIVTAQVQV